MRAPKPACGIVALGVVRRRQSVQSSRRTADQFAISRSRFGLTSYSTKRTIE